MSRVIQNAKERPDHTHQRKEMSSPTGPLEIKEVRILKIWGRKIIFNQKNPKTQKQKQKDRDTFEKSGDIHTYLQLPSRKQTIFF